MSRARKLTFSLTEAERGILRSAILMQAQAVDGERPREADTLDALAERLDAAWTAAAGRGRLYAQGEGRRKGGA